MHVERCALGLLVVDSVRETWAVPMRMERSRPRWSATRVTPFTNSVVGQSGMNGHHGAAGAVASSSHQLL